MNAPDVHAQAFAQAVRETLENNCEQTQLALTSAKMALRAAHNRYDTAYEAHEAAHTEYAAVANEHYVDYISG